MNIMTNLKTSTQIALKFTIYFSIIFSLLWIISNWVFFRQWTNNEYNRLKWREVVMNPIQRKWLWWKFKEQSSPIVVLPYDISIAEEIIRNTTISNISYVDGVYIMYAISNQDIKIMDVSRPIEMQYTLLWTTLLIIIGGTVITFWLSRIFARSSLQKINELVNYTKKLDIHNLTKKVPISWPEDDEIRIIASAFQNSLDTIKEQTDSLKDFVSYASHELKTPLSTIRWLVDLSTKTKNIDNTGPRIKKTLTEMSDLLDTLLSITKREFHDIQKEVIDVVPLLHTIWEQVQEQYQDKKITYTEQLPKKHEVWWNNEIIRIIISNILNNAYKFTPIKGSISVAIINNTISIIDNGIGISEKDQEKIRTRFRKKSTENNNGYGLGLYMVKLLIEKLWRTVTIESTENVGTQFHITMS